MRFVTMSATPKELTTQEEASATDLGLVEVCKTITNGHFENCKPYAPTVNELCLVGYIVLHRIHIVLSQNLQAQTLILAHEGHLGIVGTKHLSTKVWWPGMDRAAERYCKT